MEKQSVGRPIKPHPTDKQLEVYYFIIKHIQEHGYQPTQSEMSQALKVSRPVIEKRLVSLERKGFISREKGKSDRAIRFPNLRFEAITLSKQEIAARTRKKSSRKGLKKL